MNAKQLNEKQPGKGKHSKNERGERQGQKRHSKTENVIQENQMKAKKKKKTNKNLKANEQYQLKLNNRRNQKQ